MDESNETAAKANLPPLRFDNGQSETVIGFFSSIPTTMPLFDCFFCTMDPSSIISTRIAGISTFRGYLQLPLRGAPPTAPATSPGMANISESFPNADERDKTNKIHTKTPFDAEQHGKGCRRPVHQMNGGFF